MAPKKASKKNDEPQEGNIISDATPHTIHSIKAWAQVSELLEDELKYTDPDSKNYLWDVVEFELHKVVAHPRLVAYTEMVSWALIR
jgi:hypothetical protein